MSPRPDRQITTTSSRLRPPAVIIVPPPVRLPVWTRVDGGLRLDALVVDALAEDAAFRAWLAREGFRPVEQVGECWLYEARKP